MATISSSEFVILRPPSSIMTSPVSMPALCAGLSGETEATRAPPSAKEVSTEIPRTGYEDFPVFINSSAVRLA